MNIIACIKQVPYPDTPASSYGVDADAKKVTLPADVPYVINPDDENAVEAGVQVKEAVGGTLTVISLAVAAADEVIRGLRQALAMGADEAILLDDPAFEGGDSYSTAYTLAAAIKKIGDYDLILCGRQAADWDAGQVALGISEILGIPSATPVRKIIPGDGNVQVECVIDNGHEVLKLPLPSVLAVSNEANTPRMPPLSGVIKAKRKKIPTWGVSDIDADTTQVGASGTLTSLQALSIPEFEGNCEFISGESPEEAAAKLVELLKNESII